MRSNFVWTASLALLAAACSGSPAAGGRADRRVVAEPAAISFGEVARGEWREASVQLSTRNARPIALRGVTIEDDGIATIERVQVPATIPAHGIVTELRLAYGSSRPGRSAGKVVIELDSEATPRLEIPFDGHTTGPFLECEPASVAFDRVPVGERVEATLACANTGHDAGDGSGSFRLSNLPTSAPEFTAQGPRGQVLSAGETFTVTLGFEPRAIGPVDGWLRFDTEPLVSRSEVPLSGEGFAAPCQLEVQAQPAVTPPGTSVWAMVSVRNAGTASCYLHDVSLEGSCPAFSLRRPPALPTWLAAGETLSFPADYRPDGLGTDACSLLVEGDPPVRTTLLGECTYRGCLADSTAEFLAIRWTCPVDRHVSIENRCHAPVPVAMEIENPGGEVFVLGTPPAVLAPLASTEVPVTFTPPGDGTYQARLRVRDPEGGGADVALSGESVPRPTGVTEFMSFSMDFVAQPPDVVAVVDNGAGMAEIEARVAGQLGGLFDRIESGNRLRTEHFVAVTTSSLEGDPACPDPVRGGEDGRFVPLDGSRPRSVGRGTASPRETLEANLAVGACHTAPAQPLEAALRALSPPLSTNSDDPRHPEAADGNLGLLRPSAPRYLVIVTNRDDASPLSTSDYAARLQALGVDEVLVIAGEPGTGCSRNGTTALPGDRLSAFVSHFPYGRSVSVCEPTWPLAPLPKGIEFEDPCFGCFADVDQDGDHDDRDVEVRWDGVRLLQAEGDWTYDETGHALCLADGFTVMPGSHELWFGVTYPPSP